MSWSKAPQGLVFQLTSTKKFEHFHKRHVKFRFMEKSPSVKTVSSSCGVKQKNITCMARSLYLQVLVT